MLGPEMSRELSTSFSSTWHSSPIEASDNQSKSLSTLHWPPPTSEFKRPVFLRFWFLCHSHTWMCISNASWLQSPLRLGLSSYPNDWIYIVFFALIVNDFIVVPHAAVAVADASTIGHYRRGELLWCMDGKANPAGPKEGWRVFVGMVAMVAVVTSRTTPGCL